MEVQQLLSFDGFNNTLEVILNKQGCSKIAEITNEINVISIIGPRKSGKSWLLNKLFSQNQGFIQNTKGMNFLYDGYLIIDTEGLGQGDQKKDLQLLQIISLISSVVIYLGNSVEDFELISTLEEYEEILPPFILVMRDINQKEGLTLKDILERQFKQQNRTKRILQKIFQDFITIPSANDSVEFIDSIALLRKKILQQVKPKRIYQNIYHNGSTIIDLLTNMIQMFNNNSQLDIQQLTEQILDKQSTQLIKEAFKTYENYLVQLKLPTSTFEELKSHHKDCELKALEFLKTKLNDKDLNDELHQLCKGTFKEFCKRNEQESLNLCNQFINKEFQTLQKRLNEYRSILEYERDIKLFYQFLLEHGPKTVLKQQVYQDFYNKMMTEGTSLFIKQQNQQQQSQIIVKNENNIIIEKEKTINEMLLKMKEQDNKICIQNSQIKMLEEQLFSSEKQLEILQNELQKQKELHQQQTKQFERNIFLKESEFNKQKALNDQKIQHLTRQLELSQKKETQMDSSYMSTKSEYNNQIRDVQQKYEQMITQLQERLLQSIDKGQLLSDQLNQSEQQNSAFQIKLQNKENQIYDLQQQIQQVKSSSIQQPQFDILNNQEYETQIQHLKEIVESQEIQLKEKTSQLILLKSNLEKEQALINQEKQFLDIQLQDLKQQLINEKKNHEQTLSLFELSNDVNKSQIFSKQYIEIKDMHLNEIKQIEQEFEIQRKKMSQQIDYLNQELNKCENDLLYSQNEHTREVTQLRAQILTLEDNIQRLNREFSQVEQSKNRISKDLEEKYLLKLKTQQIEMEELKSSNINEFRLLQQKNEEQIKYLSQVYDNERQKLEQKLLDDRKNMEDKYNQMVEEFENQFDNNQDEEIKKLNKKIKQNDLQLTQLQQHWQNEYDIKQKQVLQLEQVNSSIKISLVNCQENLEQLKKKILELEQIILTRDEEIVILKQQGQYEQQNNKQEIFEKQKQQLINDKTILQQQLQNLKEQLDDQQDENIKIKVEFERQLALITQENEFNQNKIEQLQQEITNYEQKNVTQLIKIENNVAQIAFDTDLKEQQQKYEKLRTQYKEQEINNNKLVLQLKQEIELLQQQLEVQKQQPDMQTNKIGLISQIPISNSDQSIQTLQKKNEEINNQLQELKSQQERDSLLWEGKFKFLTEQKEQAKQDLQESMKKFEFTITQLQKVRQQDLEEESNSISEMLITLEKKYQLQVLDLNEHHQATILEYTSRIEQLQKELQLQSINLSISNKDDLAALYENQIEQIKLQYESKIEEIYLNQTEDRQLWRAKLSEVEEKLKEAEIRRSNMIFEHEKERAKWNIEKDELKYQKIELQEQCSNLEQQKTKSDKKNKKIGTIRSRLSPHKSPGAFSNKLGQSFDQQASMELPEENKSIHLNPGESFESYYQKQQ